MSTVAVRGAPLRMVINDTLNVNVRRTCVPAASVAIRSKVYCPAVDAMPASSVNDGLVVTGSAEPEMRFRPGGKVEPEARLHVYGGTPLNGTSEIDTLCPTLTSFRAAAFSPKSSSVGVALTTNSENCFENWTTPSLTVTVMNMLAVVVGVPVIAPAVDIVRPLGNTVADQVRLTPPTPVNV